MNTLIKYCWLIGVCGCAAVYEVPTNTKGLHHVGIHNVALTDQYSLVEKWKQTAANICGGQNKYHQLTDDDSLVWKNNIVVYPSEEQQVFVDGYFTCLN